MSPRRDLTPAEKQRAWDRYAKLGSWAKVAFELKVGVTTLREKMGVTPNRKFSSKRQATGVHVTQSAKRRDHALYDPHRDGDPIYESASAARFGDPPRGRRAMLEANAERTAPPEVHPNAKYWHL